MIPARAAVIKRIFALAADGYGYVGIVRRLTADNVPAFGGTRRSSGGRPLRSWPRTGRGRRGLQRQRRLPEADEARLRECELRILARAGSYRRDAGPTGVGAGAVNPLGVGGRIAIGMIP